MCKTIHIIFNVVSMEVWWALWAISFTLFTSRVPYSQILLNYKLQRLAVQLLWQIRTHMIYVQRLQHLLDDTAVIYSTIHWKSASVRQNKRSLSISVCGHVQNKPSSRLSRRILSCWIWGALIIQEGFWGRRGELLITYSARMIDAQRSSPSLRAFNN